MEIINLAASQENRRLYAFVSVLAIITIAYNVIEGVISVYFGLEDGSMALFGFGVDSFVEVVSGIGIWHMVRRIGNNGTENLDHFEQTALKITGAGFYVLTAGLAITAAVDLYRGHKPDTTFWGIVVSVISTATMWLLIHYKVRVGKQPTPRLSCQTQHAHAPVCSSLLFCLLRAWVTSLPISATLIPWAPL
jgi:divalent metal cation (Fe/Co/Zn/Cd) transporter